MFCMNCGEKISDDATSCPVCGRKFEVFVKPQDIVPEDTVIRNLVTPGSKDRAAEETRMQPRTASVDRMTGIPQLQQPVKQKGAVGWIAAIVVLCVLFCGSLAFLFLNRVGSAVAPKEPADYTNEELAQQYFEAGEYNEAYLYCIEALKEDPHNVYPNILLSELLLKDKQYDDAIETIQNGLTINKGDKDATVLLTEQLVQIYLIASHQIERQGDDQTALQYLYEGYNATGAGELLASIEQLEQKLGMEGSGNHAQGQGADGGGTAGTDPWVTDPSEPEDPNVTVINVFSYTDTVPNIVQRYADLHPELGIKVNMVMFATMDLDYEPVLAEALKKGGAGAPDLYAVDVAYAQRFTQGEDSGYAASYEELGIDFVDAMIEDAGIAQYAVDIGTRPSDNKVVGLGYQSGAGCFIYRRSIAKEVWGTDDPEVIGRKIGGYSGDWGKFLEAAEELKQKGYAIVSGDSDMWRAVGGNADQGWIVDGKLHIDPKREAYLDILKTMYENDYCNRTRAWTEYWYKDMTGSGVRPVFGYFGPSWLVSYVLEPTCGVWPDSYGNPYGDWAVCDPPDAFFQGGEWILANKDSKHKELLGDILQWITLEYGEDSFQYMFANGTYNQYEEKNAVTCNAVMAQADGRLDFLGGQNMYEYYARANRNARGVCVTIEDDIIDGAWLDAAQQYAIGLIDRDEAIRLFQSDVWRMYRISAE